MQLWQSLIVDYNADEQADLWDSLSPGRHLSTLRELGLALLTGLTALLALILLRRLVRRQRTSAVRSTNVEAFYARLLSLLAQPRGVAAAVRPDAARVRRKGATILRVAAELGRPSAICRAG